MQEYAKLNRRLPKIIIIFLLVLITAYLPITSFLFALKNDAFTGYFPPKFFMSESLHAGYLPLWNPYINYGFPQYGDMSSGFWSPITWLIAATVGYNVYSFTFELLLYLFLSSLGVFFICKMYKLVWQVSTMAAICYMCCGYMVGHLQHFNWISGAAFLPLCTWAYLQMINQPNTKNTIRAILLFYFLLSSAHPGIGIAAFYFFFVIAGFNFYWQIKKTHLRVSSVLKPHLFLILGLLILSAGMIIGYSDILPFFVRSQKITLQDALSNPTSITSYISFIFPFASVKNDLLFNTDISMRNCYIGIVLLPFLITAIVSSKTALQKLFLGIGLFFLLLSSGGIIKTIAYYVLPGIGYVRLNGEFRIFALLSFIIVAAVELNKFFISQYFQQRKLKLVFSVLKLICCMAFVYALFMAIDNKQSIIFYSVSGASSFPDKLKLIIDRLTWYDTLILQSTVQCFILIVATYFIKKRALNFLLLLCIADMVIATLLNVPFTGVGKKSPAELQQIFSESPAGIPKPALIPISDIVIPKNYTPITGHWSMYNKQIGVAETVAYPIMLKGMEENFLRVSKGDSSMLQKPFVFVTPNDAELKVDLMEYTGQTIQMRITTNAKSRLIIQQNAYPHWVSADEKQVLNNTNGFLSAALQKGTQNVNLSFDPKIVKFGLAFSAVVFILLFGLFLFLSFKPGYPS